METLLDKIHDSIKKRGAGYEYDPSKLYLVLSRNESEDLLGEFFQKAFDLSTEINSLVGKINSENFNRHEISGRLEVLDIEISKYQDKTVCEYLMQWYLPVKALYLYRIGLIEEAEKLTQESIAIIDELISKGIYSFLFRMILQHSNLLTLYIKNEQYERAFSLGGEIIDYLFNNKVGKSMHGEALKNAALWSEMQFLRECNAYYYFKSITDKLLRLKEKDFSMYSVLMKKITEPLQRMEISTEQRHHILQWVAAESSMIGGSKSDFYENCHDFFDEDNGLPSEYLKAYFIESLIYEVNNNTHDDNAHVFYERLLSAKNNLGKEVIELATKSI